MCPKAPNAIDLMKYYKNYCMYFERIKASNWDMAKMIMTAQSYTVKP